MPEAAYLNDLEINWSEVEEVYHRRKRISERLRNHLNNREEEEYVNLGLGMTERDGNWSASDNNLGPQIRDNNPRWIEIVFKLAQNLSGETNAENVPKIIREANISYLKIGVGSEMACLLQPDRFWIGNRRTFLPWLIVEMKDVDRAKELYDMQQKEIFEILERSYPDMQENWRIIENWAKTQNKTGEPKYIWIDAICNEIYEKAHFGR